MKMIMKKINETVISDCWIESRAKGNGAVGITLEHLLGKKQENYEQPDYFGVELKTKCSKKENYVSLFRAIPDSRLFKIQQLPSQYGYPDSQLPQFNIFYLSVYGSREVFYNNYYFKLEINKEKKKVIFNVFDENHNLIDSNIYWTFKILKEKLERKLKYLAFIHAERKFEHNKILFKYTKADFYELISFEKFLELIKLGIIRITFQIGVYKSGEKFGQIYDHGTVFNIHEKNIEKLFKKIELE